MKKSRSALDEIRALFPSTPEFEVARKKERLRLKLAFNMVAARETAGLSQQSVAENVGKTQSWISKVENPNHDHQIETILEYILALDGELKLEFKVGGAVFRILDFKDEETFKLPVRCTAVSRKVAISGDVADTSASTMIIIDESRTQDGFSAVAEA